MLVIHKSDCPALCRGGRVLPDRAGDPVVGKCGHELLHRCRGDCPTAEQLRELVEAAKAAREELSYFGTSPIRLVIIDLDAALVPFREKK